MSAAEVTVPATLYTYLIMDMEQFGLVDHEVALLQSLGKQCGESGHSLAAVAAAGRLLAEGRPAQARTLLCDAVEAGCWNSAMQLMLKAFGHDYHPHLSMTPHVRSQLLETSPHWKELALAQYVLDHACPGNPLSVCDAMDHFADGRWETLHQWSKSAGNLKSGVLCSSLRGAVLGSELLEIGTYCGYTALRVVAEFPSIRVSTIEVDPVYAIVARNMIALSGVANSLDVWTGHSKYLLPRLAKRQMRGQKLKYSALYMDRWGSEYHDDFAVLDSLRILERSALIVADQVLWTGASLFLWDVANRVNCSTRIVPVRVNDDAIQEDFLAVSVGSSSDEPCRGFDIDTASRQMFVVKPPPSCLYNLHADAELFRKKWVEGRSASAAEKVDFARAMQQQMLAALAEIGYASPDGALPSAP
eukprot:TRINITY_DN19499_c0_g1_i1.p1 TRINITY_DN19499_c0_g1~~TRINITY_DN19499_c0_g1_i1.p1  ORF type:complete len:483 (-),score=59.24 TRINITY_DN19499_c0_g1_i1:467-1717(-)